MNPRSLLLEELTSPDIEALLESGYRTVIIGAGSIEQHGPHLPLFVDAEHGKALSNRVAELMGSALVAPTIRVGISEHHMGFRGTITLSESTFSAVCHDYVSSLVRHGFEKICFVPTHGGNFRPLENMLDSLNQLADGKAQVLAYHELTGVIDVWQRVIEEESGLGARVGGHADIAETSLMEHLHPQHVMRERAVEGVHPERNEEFLQKMIMEGFKSITPNGILGDARGGTAAMGQRCIDEMAKVITAYFTTSS